MNCRHLNKFVCANINFKSFSSYPPVQAEQIYSCFQSNNKENLRSLRFVPKERAPKISAETYHDSAQQAMISKRIASLQNRHAGTAGESKLLTTRLQNLMQMGQPSLMNFSTKQIVKTRNVKNISKHNIGSGISSSHSSFVRKPNTLLQKFMLSYAESPPKRFESTESWKFRTETRKDRRQRDIRGRAPKTTDNTSNRPNRDKMEFPARNRIEPTRAEDMQEQRTADHPRRAEQDHSAAAASLELAFNIKDKLEDLSARIRSDLMKIDGSLKEKIASMKTKFNRGIVQTRRKEDPYVRPIPENDDRLHWQKFDLMPKLEKKTGIGLNILNEHSKNLDFNRNSSILRRTFQKTGKYRVGRDMEVTDAPVNHHEYSEKILDRFPIKGELMEIPLGRIGRPTGGRKHIVEVTTKNFADADGVYFAPRRAAARKMYSM